MQLFFNNDINEIKNEICFGRDESRHISKVLRKDVGDIIYITDGKGNLYEVRIISADKNRCVAEIINRSYHENHPYYLHMAVAPTKMNDRFEWFLEKAVEIGVNEITPLLCENSERNKIKLDRFEKIIQSAVKQSLRYHLPILNNLNKFDEFIKLNHIGGKFIAHCLDVEKKNLFSNVESHTNCTILIGPEGDFSNTEIDKALKNDFVAISLGESRLRTETAAIVACHTVALANARKSVN